MSEAERRNSMARTPYFSTCLPPSFPPSPLPPYLGLISSTSLAPSFHASSQASILPSMGMEVCRFLSFSSLSISLTCFSVSSFSSRSFKAASWCGGREGGREEGR